MTALLAAVFVASLVGSLHCAGMCGGIVVLCVSGRPVDHGRRAWPAPVAYNLGRLVVYAGLGAGSGAIGAAIDFGGESVGLPRSAAILAGCVLILLGGVALLQSVGLRIAGPRVPRPLQRVVQAGVSAVSGFPPVRRAALVGLLTGFIPCGWLYAFVLGAAGTGGAVGGALLMTAFWLGTVPVMLAVGLGAQTILRPVRRHVPTLAALSIFVLGAVTVFGRLDRIGIAATGATPVVATDPLTAIESATEDGPACCNDEP